MEGDQNPSQSFFSTFQFETSPNDGFNQQMFSSSTFFPEINNSINSNETIEQVFSINAEKHTEKTDCCSKKEKSTGNSENENNNNTHSSCSSKTTEKETKSEGHGAGGCCDTPKSSCSKSKEMSFEINTNSHDYAFDSHFHDGHDHGHDHHDHDHEGHDHHDHGHEGHDHGHHKDQKKSSCGSKKSDPCCKPSNNHHKDDHGHKNAKKDDCCSSSSSCSGNSNQTEFIETSVNLKSQLDGEKIATSTFQVEGMTCSDCATTLSKHLSSLMGVYGVRVGLLTKKAEIDYGVKSSDITIEYLINEISKMGFEGSFLDTKVQGETEFHPFIVQIQWRGELNTQSAADLHSNNLNNFNSLNSTSDRLQSLILNCYGVVDATCVFETSVDPSNRNSRSPSNNGAYEYLISDQTDISSENIVQFRVQYNADFPGVGPRTIIRKIEEILSQSNDYVKVKFMSSASSKSDSQYQSTSQSGFIKAWRFFTSIFSLSKVSFTTTPRPCSKVQEWKKRLLWCCFWVAPIFYLAIILPILDNESLYDMVQITPFSSIPYINCNLTLDTIIQWSFSTPIQFWLGLPFYRASYSALRYSRKATMDTLIVLSTSTAYFYSVINAIAHWVYPSYPAEIFFSTSAFLLTLITFARLLEMLAEGKTSKILSKLQSIQVESAILLESSDPGNLQSQILIEDVVDIHLVQRGDLLKVLTGKRIPVDGIVIDGQSDVDESMITGESIPVLKKPGAVLIGGTINVGKEALRMRVTRTATEGTLSSIMRMVEEAQQERPKVQRTADQVASYFVPVILVLAVITFVGWYLIAMMGWVSHIYTNDFTFAMIFAITVLVISCPCAISLAVPTAIMVATGVGVKFGVLFKSGAVIEQASKIDTVVFDKTGTLTNGVMTVSNYLLFPSSIPSFSNPSSNPSLSSSSAFQLQSAEPVVWSGGSGSEFDFLNSHSNHPIVPTFFQFLGTAELSSDHPIARSLVKFVRKQIGCQLADANSSSDDNKAFTVTTGCGIAGVLQNHHIAAGNITWIYSQLHQSNISQSFSSPSDSRSFLLKGIPFAEEANSESFVSMIQDWESSGKTVMAVAIDHQLAGFVALADQPRAKVSDVIKSLEKRGIEVWMLSGDRLQTARSIAKQIGIDSSRVIAQVTPKEKANHIRQLVRDGKRVAMVGDGVNDSVALAEATVGIAINSSPSHDPSDDSSDQSSQIDQTNPSKSSGGGASDIAVEAAGIVLMQSDLESVVTSLHLAKWTMRVVFCNFIWSFFYNVLSIPLAMGFLFPIIHLAIPPSIAGLSELFSSVPVILFSLLLNLYRPSPL